jgi:glutaredoxin-dependent peroxiredoxin
VRVIAILTQSPEAVRRYIEETGLAFDVLLDEGREVVRAYGVWHRVGLDAWNIAHPAVFLIDRDRSIRYSFVSDRQTEFPSPTDILNAID